MSKLEAASMGLSIEEWKDAWDMALKSSSGTELTDEEFVRWTDYFERIKECSTSRLST